MQTGHWSLWMWIGIGGEDLAGQLRVLRDQFLRQAEENDS